MTQAGERRPDRTGLFLNPAAACRAGFQATCGEMFSRLHLADCAEQAVELLAQQQVDLVVLDLERFEPGVDLAALGALVAGRCGAPMLVLCPFSTARWLPALMAFGPFAYAIAPTAGAELRAQVAAQLEGAARAPASPEELRELLVLRSRAQQALAEADDLGRLAERLCEILCSCTGVSHAALFHLQHGGNLRLEAQHGSNGLDLARLFQRSERLLQSRMRHLFPALLAAAGGEMALLDAPEKAGEAELTRLLRGHAVEMALGLPIASDGPGAPRGALSLLFDRRVAFSQDQLATFESIAQLAAYGMRMAEMNRETEQLLVKLTHVATVDALTGVANRRHGEELLEQEIRRARRYGLPLALITFDIDRFKDINERYGHPVGDVALRTVAECAEAVLRTTDTLVRSGGEEFQIIIPHASAIDALKVAEKVRHEVEQTPVPGCDRVTISLGVAQAMDQESADSLVLRANAALARAKRGGRNCVELAMQ
jgi:diguanylate cyclase (GGDEF)-like protein